MATYFLRPPFTSTRAAQRAHRKLTAASGAPHERRSRRRWPIYVGGVVLALIIAAGAAAMVYSRSKATISVGGNGLAQITLPMGGGKIESVSVRTVGKGSHPVRVSVQGDPEIVPLSKIDADRQLSITVTVKRPSWISWLSGATETLHLSMTTPAASLNSHFLNVHGGATAPLTLSFKQPVAEVSYGTAGHMTKKTLATPQSKVQIPRPALAGTEQVSALMRSWEKAKAATISWFPAGAGATAIASPAPGATISANTPITLTLSETVSKALGGHMPTVTPAGSGSWKTLSPHAIEFVPAGYGYGLDANVQMTMPAGVQLVGGHASGSDNAGSWSVPNGTTTRLQQLLSILGYLPFKVDYAHGQGVATNPLAQEQAATETPAATFDWAYGNVPPTLKSMWEPGTFGTMTKGAIMAFEDDNGLTTDGVAGPGVWKALISAVDANKTRPGGDGGGYTYVYVQKGSPETLSLWHDGKTVFNTLVNTGVPGADTEDGTYPVFEHLISTTMTGTNVDGSHYSDPGIPDVSYFNGGDALHGYIRGSYGFPQSNGCVEMSYASAATVYPYTPIGTLVTVTD